MKKRLDHIKKIKARAKITRSAHVHLGKKYGNISKFIKIVLLIGSTTSTTLNFTRNFNEEIYLTYSRHFFVDVIHFIAF